MYKWPPTQITGEMEADCVLAQRLTEGGFTMPTPAANRRR